MAMEHVAVEIRPAADEVSTPKKTTLRGRVGDEFVMPRSQSHSYGRYITRELDDVARRIGTTPDFASADPESPVRGGGPHRSHSYTHLGSLTSHRHRMRRASMYTVSQNTNTPEVVHIVDEWMSGGSKGASSHEEKTEEKISLLQQWMELALHNGTMHRTAATLYKRRALLMSVPSIAMSSVVGTTGLSGVVGKADSFGIMIGVMGLLSAVLTGAMQLLRLAETSTSHAIHANEFAKMAREIEVELVLQGTSNKKYASRGEFIKQCNDRLDRLMERAPSIPDFVERKQTEKSRIRMMTIRNTLVRSAELSLGGGD